MRGTKERSGLETVMTSGPVERGLYFVEGGDDVLRALERGLVGILADDAGRFPFEMAPTAASADSAGPRRRSRAGTLIWLDTDRGFSRFSFEVAALTQGLAPDRALRHVRVRDAGSVGDYIEALSEIPRTALWAYPSAGAAGRRSIFSRASAAAEPAARPSALWWTPLVVISDLFGPFERTGWPEREWIPAFREAVVQLTHLAERAIVVARVPKWPAAPALTFGARTLFEKAVCLSAPGALPVSVGSGSATPAFGRLAGVA